jgi:hypothetical protein
MATPDFLKQIQELSEDPQNISSEQLDTLMQTSLQFFDQMRGQVTSQDPEEQQRAQKVLADLQIALEEQSKHLCKSLGIDPSQLTTFAEDPDALSPEDAAALSKAQKEYELRKERLQPKRPIKRSQRLIFS